MEISGMNGIQGLDFKNMKEMMRGKEGLEETENALQGVVEQVTASAAAQQSGGVVSRNFVSAYQGENDSNYAQKTLAGKQAASAQVSRQNAALNSAIAQIASTDSYAARTLAGKRAARSMMQEMQRTVQEESERNLKENRNAVESAANESASQGSVPPADTASVATVSSPAAFAPATSAPAPDTSTSDSAPAAAPSTPSVDVTV